MNDLKELETILDTMISKQKEKKARTFVAKYKGKNLVVRSGKSSWKAVHHAKAAIIQHFCIEEKNFCYDGWVMGESSYKDVKERREEFRKRLFELIEIVELTE